MLRLYGQALYGYVCFAVVSVHSHKVGRRWSPVKLLYSTTDGMKTTLT